MKKVEFGRKREQKQVIGILNNLQ